MGLRFHFRPLAHSVITITLVGLAVFGFSVYWRGFTVPDSLINSRVAQLIASRYGLGYHLNGLRIGCLRTDCSGDINVGAVDLQADTPEILRIHLNSTDWSRRSPITAHGLEIRSGSRPPMLSLNNLQTDLRSGHTVANGVRIQLVPDDPISQIGKVEFDRTMKVVIADVIRVQLKNRPPLSIEQLAVEGWQRSAADGWTVLGRVTGRGVKLTIDQTTNSADLCGPMPASDNLERAIEPLRPLGPLFRQALLKLRGDLLRAAVAMGIIILLLKFLSVLWVQQWFPRLALSVIPAGAPFVVYFLFIDALPTISLLLTVGGIAVALAILFCIFVYRRSGKRYQRWEPFLIDLASAFSMLPLVAYGYQLPSQPAAAAGYRVERLDVANLQGQSDKGIQFQIPQSSLRGAQVALPTSDNNLLRVELSSGDIPNATIAASPSTRITLENMQIDGVRTEFDPKQRKIQNISAIVRLAGLIESNAIQKQVQNIEFLRGMNSRSDRVSFLLDLHTSTANVVPAISTEFHDTQHLIAVNAALALRPQDCTPTYVLAARILTKPLMLTAQVDGDTQRVNIRTLRTLPGSPIQLGTGTGTVSLDNRAAAMNLALKKIGGTSGSTQVALESLSLSASLPRTGQNEPQTAEIVLGPIDIRTSKGWEVQLGKASMNVGRMPSGASVPVAFKSRIEDIRIRDTEDDSIQAGVPALETTISGQTTSEIIPRRFSGNIRFQVSGVDATNELLDTDKPISVNADFWRGLVSVPQQDVTFHSSALSDNVLELPTRFALSGRLLSVFPRMAASLQTEAAVSHFEKKLGSIGMELEDARFAGGVEVNNNRASASLNYTTGWNVVELNSQPAAFCLDEISKFEVATNGTVSKIAPGSFPSLDRFTPTNCLSLPSLPQKLQFRLSGVFPPGPQTYAVQLENTDGGGFRVRDIQSKIRNLRIEGGRLGDVHTEMTFAGIQNLQGSSGLDIRSDVQQNGKTVQLHSTLLNSEGTPLLDAALSSLPGKLTLDATQHVSADEILKPLGSLIPHLASDFDGIHPKARLATLHAEAEFDNDMLLDASAVGQFSAGEMLSADSPQGQVDISTGSSNPGPAFRLNIGRPSGIYGPHPVVAGIDLRGAHVQFVTDQNVQSNMYATLGLETKGSLFTTPHPPLRPILNNVFQVGAGLSRQASKIGAVLRGENAPEPLANVEWDVRLAQTSPSKPLVRLENDTVHLNIGSASFAASWDAGPSIGAGHDRSKLTGLIALDSTLSDTSNHLLLDALVPVQLSYSNDGGPETRIESTLPIQVAFAERLGEARDKARHLWNEDFYSQFWRDHPSRFPGTKFVPPLDLGELPLGPVLLHDIHFPGRPLQVSIGYSHGLQVRVPISGSALFGNVEGQLESSLTASATTAALDTRLNLDLTNIQAAGLETVQEGARSAILEDELDGTLSLSVDGLTMDRDTVSALRTGRLSSDELSKIGLSVHMSRTAAAAGLPGVFQSSSEVEINLLNEVLNRIAKDLRLSAPPRALTYKNLSLDFDVDHGEVQAKGEILKIGGVELFSSDFVDVDGEIRAHVGRSGERIMLRDLMEMLSELTSSTGLGRTMK